MSLITFGQALIRTAVTLQTQKRILEDRNRILTDNNRFLEQEVERLQNEVNRLNGLNSLFSNSVDSLSILIVL